MAFAHVRDRSLALGIFITRGRHPRMEGTLAAASLSRDVAARKATLRRPFWFVVWASLAYAAFALIPTRLPIYGDVQSAWAFLGLLVEPLLLLGATALEARRHGTYWHQLLAAALAGPLTALFFALGAILLITGELPPLGAGALGTLCLIILGAWEAAAMKSDIEGRPIADWFSTLFH